MHKERLERWNYCGFSKVRYQSCHRQIADENWTSARIISGVMLVMMTGFTVLSILNIINRAYYLLYVFFVGCTVIVKVIFQNLFQKKNSWQSTV